MNRLAVALVAFAGPACASTPPTAAPVEEAAPPSSEPSVAVQPQQPTETSSSLDAAAIADALAYSESKSGHAVAIFEDGHQVASAFHNGWDPEKPHGLASGTKSFWGPLVGAAIDDGIVSSFDELAADTITEWKGDPKRAAITLRQLLSLTSGLAPDLGVTIEDIATSDMFTLTVAADSEHDPGAKWAYSDSSHTAIGVVLDRKLAAKGSSLAEYIQTRLLAPLAIASPPWLKDGAEHLLMPSGARLTPTQWAAYGELIRTGGLGPDGARMISAEHLAACFEPTAAPPAGQFYGLGWWLTSYTSYAFDLPEDMVMAGGSGGQFLFVIPSRNMTIVRFGEGEEFVDGEFLCRLFHGKAMDACPKRGGA